MEALHVEGDDDRPPAPLAGTAATALRTTAGMMGANDGAVIGLLHELSRILPSAIRRLAARGGGPMRPAASRTEVPQAEMKAGMLAGRLRGHGSPAVEGARFDLLQGHAHRVPDAQAYFDQGLRLAYAFNHDGARRAFGKAQKLISPVPWTLGRGAGARLRASTCPCRTKRSRSPTRWRRRRRARWPPMRPRASRH